MSRPKSPCDRNCPRRKAGCHDRAYCPDWGIYKDADAQWQAERRKYIMAERDMSELKKAGQRRYLQRNGLKPPMA